MCEDRPVPGLLDTAVLTWAFTWVAGLGSQMEEESFREARVPRDEKGLPPPPGCECQVPKHLVGSGLQPGAGAWATLSRPPHTFQKLSLAGALALDLGWEQELSNSRFLKGTPPAYLLWAGPWAAREGTRGDGLAPHSPCVAGVMVFHLVCLIQRWVLKILVLGPRWKPVMWEWWGQEARSPG